MISERSLALLEMTNSPARRHRFIPVPLVLGEPIERLLEFTEVISLKDVSLPEPGDREVVRHGHGMLEGAPHRRGKIVIRSRTDHMIGTTQARKILRSMSATQNTTLESLTA